jgi:hypothetical protein
MDREIQKAYKLIAAGRVIIRALESVKVAGVNDQGYPKLAICRADAVTCECRMNRDGSARMSFGEFRARGETKIFDFGADSFPRRTDWGIEGRAALPLIPVHLRPRTALDAYHILWEAEWRRIPPRDPYLLRRLAGDMWVVVAAWDLTEVERAAMATRISS